MVDGSRPSSFWLQAQVQSLPIHSWWQSPTHSPITDTIVSHNGQPCDFFGPRNLSSIQFIGEWILRENTSCPYPLEYDYSVVGDSIKLFAASPFWITLIGGRNPDEMSQDEPVVVQCEWCEQNINDDIPLSFTPGQMPHPSLTLEGWCYKRQPVPFTRTVELQTSDNAESLLFQFSIETDQVGDTVILSYLR